MTPSQLSNLEHQLAQLRSKYFGIERLQALSNQLCDDNEQMLSNLWVGLTPSHQDALRLELKAAVDSVLNKWEKDFAQMQIENQRVMG